jgi:hypothetical protein
LARGLGRLRRDLGEPHAETRLWRSPIRRRRWQEVAAGSTPRHYADPLALIDDPAVDALVIVSLTHAPRASIGGPARKKPTFCESRRRSSWTRPRRCGGIAGSGMFSRWVHARFDAGHASAKQQIEQGASARRWCSSTSRDPFRRAWST